MTRYLIFSASFLKAADDETMMFVLLISKLVN